MVRAKFSVNAITNRQGSKYNETTKLYDPCVVSTIELWPVCGGSEENKKFFASTPSGKIELGCCNQEAVKMFELSKEYFIDFKTPLEVADERDGISK